MNEIGQFAAALAPGGVPGWLELAAVAALVAAPAVVLGRGIAAARRTRRRNGRQAPGPPPGQVRQDETEAWAAIEQELTDDGLGRTVAARVVRVTARGRRPARMTRKRAVRR